jgi:hypothetical protein
MAGLGLRYCPQHPGQPLVLTPTGRSWRCEVGTCAHTESSGNRRHGHARTLGGQPITRRGADLGQAGSSVERAVIERESNP